MGVARWAVVVVLLASDLSPYSEPVYNKIGVLVKTHVSCRRKIHARIYLLHFRGCASKKFYIAAADAVSVLAQGFHRVLLLRK